MIEFGLPLKQKQYQRCLQTANSYFIPRWGDYSKDGFTNAPKPIEGVTTSLNKKNKFLGGLYELDIKKSWFLNEEAKWIIHFNFKPWGKTGFCTKSNHSLANLILNKLNSNKKLVNVLTELDLVGVQISQENSRVQLKFTPMGGGMCYMVVPPVRYTIPLPYKQIHKVAWAMEQTGKQIQQILIQNKML